MDLAKLPLANLKRNPARTIALALLVAVLAFAMLAGALVMSSLRNGLTSLEARMGADLIVAPQSAKYKTNLSDFLFEGVPGSFYMDSSYLDKVRAVEGVEKASPQYYLATVKAGCCTMPVQVIGFDPATDFSIQPWIARSYASELGLDDVVVGCNISGAVGAQIKLYGVVCTIVGKLDETGTSLDTAVFATGETVKHLIQGSIDQGISVLAENDPDHVISTIQVKVADGANPQDVADRINIHMRGAWAETAKAMSSGVADSIAGLSRVIAVIAALIWLFAVVVLVVAFIVVGRQRTREFAVLRVLGASRKGLAVVVFKEAALIGVIGAATGIVLAAVAMYAFGGAIEGALGVPFLMPSVPSVALYALAAFAIGLLAGPAAAALSALRLSKVDTGQILREE